MKFENFNDANLFEIQSNIGNRSGPDADLELNPVGSGELKVTGNVAITGGRQIKVYGNNTLTIDGVISGAGASLALQSGFTPTVILGANNTYTGSTIIDGGTLQVGPGGTTGSLGIGSIVNQGALIFSMSNAGAVSLPAAGVSGSGSLSVTARDIAINSNISQGSITLTQSGGGALYQGIELGAAAPTLTATAITLSGDVGKRTSDGNSLALDTSAANGTINLNISLCRSGVWYIPTGFTANAGNGAINVTGSGPASSGWRDTPVTLTGAINISANINSNAGVTLNATGASTVSGVLSGAMSLTKTGAGALSMSANPTYTGTTTVSGGTLSLTNTANWTATHNIVVDGGTYELAGTGSRQVNMGATPKTISFGAGGRTFNVNGVNFYPSTTVGQTLVISTAGGAAPQASLVGTGGINTDNDTVNFNIARGAGASDLVMTGPLWNGGTVNKTGNGILTLTAANTHSGATTVNGGTLVYQNSYASPSHTIATGATLEFDVASGTANRAATTFSGAGTLRKTGAGTLVWGAASATFSLGSGALIDVQAGTFAAGSSANEVWTNNKADLNVAAGATFDAAEGSALANGGVFVDALSGAGTIKVGYTDGGPYADVITFGVDNGSGTFDGVLANATTAGRYTKAGSGTQTLTSANTYTGTTTVNGGVLNLAASQTIKIGNALVVNSGATVNLAAAGDAIRDLSTITLNGGTLADTTATAGHNHAILLSAGRTLNMQNGASILGTGAAAGHANYGQIYLGTGTTTINVTGTPASTWNADIRWGSTSGATTINIDAGSTLIVAGHLGNLEGSQWGYLNLTGSGTLIMTDGTGSQNTPTIGPNATMQIGNGGTTGDLPNAAGAGGVTNNGTLSFNRSNAYTPIRAINGTGQVVQNGTGTVTLSQANTYTGATVVNNGILKAGVASVANVSGAFGNNSAVTLANISGAGLDITGFDTQIGSLGGGGAAGGNVSLGAAVLTVGTLNTFTSFDGSISGAGGRLVKKGVGTLTLGGNNSYSGGTSVDDGELLINGTHTGGGLISVSATATLGGGGQAGNAEFLSGGTLAPGRADPGDNWLQVEVLTLGHDLTQLNFDLGAPDDGLASRPENDLVVAAEIPLLRGVLNVNPLAGFASAPPGSKWRLFENAGGGTPGAHEIILGAGVPSDYTIQAYVGDNSVYLVAVPEAATSGLTLFGLLLLLRRRA